MSDLQQAMNPKSWTPERKAKFQATMAAKKAAKTKTKKARAEVPTKAIPLKRKKKATKRRSRAKAQFIPLDMIPDDKPRNHKGKPTGKASTRTLAMQLLKIAQQLLEMK